MSESLDSLPVAVIGAGPVGLAAAAELAGRGLPFVVLEAGAGPGQAVADWAHVRLFSPWSECLAPAALRLLATTDWQSPPATDLPTGGELVERYLAPLAAHPAIAPNLRFGAKVEAVSRLGFDKVRSKDRERQPFELRLAGGERLLARAVVDASGTWWTPNPLGAGGLPAEGESEQADRLRYGIPDVLGRERARYAGRRVLVVGSGYSAMNVILDLLALRRAAPATTIHWAMRREQLGNVFGGGAADQLPARGALGTAARRAVESGRVQLLSPFRIARLAPHQGALEVSGTLASEPESLVVDEVVVATGFRPDLALLREVRVALDPWLESAAVLGPMIDPNLHSCGSVPPHGARELAHPEPGLFVVGAKSYGRAPTFLLLTGYEQARSVVAALAGDKAAAERVELVLPETGVCSGAPAVEAEVGCCGGPAPAEAKACCVADAVAKEAGAAGCGCGPAQPVRQTAEA